LPVLRTSAAAPKTLSPDDKCFSCFNAESTYDWGTSQWTIPINVFASQVLPIAGHPTSVTLGARYYAEGPDGTPEWGLRFVVTLLFPK